MKRWTVFLSVLVLLICCCLPVCAAETEDAFPYICDTELLLTDSEWISLEELAEQISRQYQCAVYFVTVDDYTYYGDGSIYEVAKEIYLTYDLGWGTEKSGVLLLLSMAALGSTNFYAATYAADLQFGNASLFFVVYALAEVAVLTVVGRLSDRLPMGMLLIPGMVVSALGLLWLSSVHSAAPFLLASIPIGVGTGMIVPVAQAAAFRGVEKHRRGMASATYYIAFDGGMCLGSLIWGFAIEGAGFRGMYRYAAALLVVTAIICAAVTALKKENKGSARPVSDGR